MTTTMRVLAIMGLVGLAACETVEGAGQDVQSAGRAIEDASRNAQ